MECVYTGEVHSSVLLLVEINGDELDINETCSLALESHHLQSHRQPNSNLNV